MSRTLLRVPRLKQSWLVKRADSRDRSERSSYFTHGHGATVPRLPIAPRRSPNHTGLGKTHPICFLQIRIRIAQAESRCRVSNAGPIVVLPLQVGNLAGIPVRTIRREFQRPPVQVEKTSGRGIFRLELYQNPTVSGYRDPAALNDCPSSVAKAPKLSQRRESDTVQQTPKHRERNAVSILGLRNAFVCVRLPPAGKLGPALWSSVTRGEVIPARRMLRG